jgi:hypothetical protein
MFVLPSVLNNSMAEKKFFEDKQDSTEYVPNSSALLGSVDTPG